MTTSTSKFRAILGQKIVDASLDVGDAGITLQNGACMAIYNEFSIFDKKGRKPLTAEYLLGRVLIDANELSSSIEIVLEGDVVIIIDMNDDAYTGPEAVQLLVPGFPIVVWN